MGNSHPLSTVGGSTINITTDENHNRHAVAPSDPEISLRLLYKRNDRLSPFSSPNKVTHPPLSKKRRRSRSDKGRCKNSNSEASDSVHFQTYNSSQRYSFDTKLNIHDFLTTKEENDTFSCFCDQVNTYMFLKHLNSIKDQHQNMLNLQEFFSVKEPTHTEKSNVAYLEVMDAVADRKDTLVSMLDNLYQQFIIRQRKSFLVIEGDAKIYELLQSLKFEYGRELEWVQPYPGDWHLLKNFQLPLMKAYFDAGLKDIANAAGYPIASIQSCGQFKRTNQFILDAWEAVYRVMVNQFFEYNQSEQNELGLLIVRELQTLSKNDFTSQFSEKLANLDLELRTYKQEFAKFIQMMAKMDKTWCFWAQFVFQDAMAYVSLLLAIRSGNWDIRVTSIKSMVSLFSAFDHNTYQKLIAQHLADIKHMPQGIVEMFRQGAFVVNITGRPWHAVAIDESHEMLINKKCKTTIGRPTPEYIRRRAQYLAFRAKTLDNLTLQLSPDVQHKKQHCDIEAAFTSSPRCNQQEDRIKNQMKCIYEYNMLDNTTRDRGLINPFSNKQATPEQTHDLLNFRTIGQREYEQYVLAVVLKQPSTQPTIRKKRLFTFSHRKGTKKRVLQLEKDRKLVIAAMKKKMLYSRRTGVPIDGPVKQLIQFPLAISDNEGRPLHGQKSNITKVYEARYKNSNPPVMLNDIPWVPETVLHEGMMMINTTPLGNQKTLKDYTNFLIKRFIVFHLIKGAKEIHIIFDNPGQLPNTPKQFEQEKRNRQAKMPANHCCEQLHNKTTLSSTTWRESFFNCRTCKRYLVKFVGKYILENIGSLLQPHQTVYVAGATDDCIAWFVCGNAQPQPNPIFHSNAEETDSRIWLHTKKTKHTKILIVSCDTDVYHIGMTTCVEKNIIVQVSKLGSRQMRLLDLSELLNAFSNDPDLVSINSAILPKVFQTLYVVTGCDYISFFSQIGKATFLSSFFQYASFITAAQSPDTPGSLSDTGLPDDNKLGYLAFLRLIGVVYFKKHCSAFDVGSPVALFRICANSTITPLEHHHKWIDKIRETIWDRISFENQTIPSNDALCYHWKRSCWILHMWQQATVNTITLLPLINFGWAIKEGNLTIVWDSEENLKQIQSRVSLLLQGCKCRTGCKTRHCKCRKEGRHCSEGCQCHNCGNLEQQQYTPDVSPLVVEEELEHSDSDNELEEFMDWVFGEDNMVEGSNSDDDINKGMDLCS